MRICSWLPLGPVISSHADRHQQHLLGCGSLGLGSNGNFEDWDAKIRNVHAHFVRPNRTISNDVVEILGVPLESSTTLNPRDNEELKIILAYWHLHCIPVRLRLVRMSDATWTFSGRLRPYSVIFYASLPTRD